MSRISFLLSLLLVFCFAFTPNLSAQEQGYEVVEYMKVLPGQRDNYLAAEKIWRKIHQHRLEQGKIRFWYIFQVLSPGGTDTEYDYMVVTGYKNWDAIEELRLNWRENMPEMTEDDIAVLQNTGKTRNLVKREIWRTHDRLTRNPNQ
ncbi:MAG: hypothetical protein AAFV07_05620, partial [Bacteroidota bacterium]